MLVTAMVTTRMKNSNFRSISLTTPEHRNSLLHGKGRRKVHSLLGKLVVHFDLDLVQPRLQVGSRKGLLQRHLITHIAHRVGGLDGMDNCFVISICNIIFDRSRRFMRFFVDAQIVNLHPEIQLLVALK